MRLAGCAAAAWLLWASGCAAPPPPSSPGAEGAEPAAAPPAQVASIPVSMAAGAGGHGPVPFHAAPASALGGPVEVGPGATALAVEARWSCRSPACALRLDVQGPEGESAHASWGPSPLRARLAAPAPGRWGFALFPDGPVAGVEGEIVVTVAYGGGAGGA